MKSYLNTTLSRQKRMDQELARHSWVMGIGLAICMAAIALAYKAL